MTGTSFSLPRPFTPGTMVQAHWHLSRWAPTGACEHSGCPGTQVWVVVKGADGSGRHEVKRLVGTMPMEPAMWATSEQFEVMP